MRLIVLLSLVLPLWSCSSVPAGVRPVAGFDVERYMGTWFEIARLDHRFERGLEQVTATYSLNDDGTVRVENRGFATADGEWQNAVGRARFSGDETIGHLEVSFFGPFYGAYIIFGLDKDAYQYAFVTSGEDYLWLLSRSPVVSEQLKEQFLRIASEAGYEIDKLIFVRQL